jgi:hypothetical protein
MRGSLGIVLSLLEGLTNTFLIIRGIQFKLARVGHAVHRAHCLREKGALFNIFRRRCSMEERKLVFVF